MTAARKGTETGLHSGSPVTNSYHQEVLRLLFSGGTQLDFYRIREANRYS
jgi:hypothetical protein